MGYCCAARPCLLARWPQAIEPKCTQTESEERAGHLTVQGF